MTRRYSLLRPRPHCYLLMQPNLKLTFDSTELKYHQDRPIQEPVAL